MTIQLLKRNFISKGGLRIINQLSSLNSEVLLYLPFNDGSDLVNWVVEPSNMGIWEWSDSIGHLAPGSLHAVGGVFINRPLIIPANAKSVTLELWGYGSIDCAWYLNDLYESLWILPATWEKYTRTFIGITGNVTLHYSMDAYNSDQYFDEIKITANY